MKFSRKTCSKATMLMKRKSLSVTVCILNAALFTVCSLERSSLTLPHSLRRNYTHRHNHTHLLHCSAHQQSGQLSHHYLKEKFSFLHIKPFIRILPIIYNVLPSVFHSIIMTSGTVYTAGARC